MSRTAYFILVLLCALLFPWSSAFAQSGGKVDSCKLLSADQASNILGVKLKQKKIHTYNEDDPGAASMCNFMGGGMRGGFILKVLKIKYASAEREIEKEQNAAKAYGKKTFGSTPKVEFESVSGLGDGAYIETAGARLFELNILYHGNGISIVRSTKITPTTKSQSIQLAKIVLGNL